MAAIETLTDKAIKAAIKTAIKTAIDDGIKKVLNDGGGLKLEVQPTGVGWWRLRYWYLSKENRLSLGTYPEVSLAIARQRRRDIVSQIAAGIDPSEQRQADKAAKKARREVAKRVASGEALPGSFEAVARDWLTSVHAAKVSADHAARTRIRFEQDVFPYLGQKSIAGIEAPELLTVLRRVTTRGAIETAHRIKDSCGQVFRFGIATGACQRNPAADLRDALPPVPTRHLAAVIEPKEAGELLRAIRAYRGNPLTKAALELAALLFQRPGNIRSMEWSEIDAARAVWTIPGAKMKRSVHGKNNGHPHLVPLAPQALAVLEEIRSITGQGRFVFPSVNSKDRCISENTLNAALRRLGYGSDEATTHGFRAMARTLAAERLDIPAEVIEAQLAHSVPDALGRAYNRTQFLDQRKDLMAKWATYLDFLRTSTKDIVITEEISA
jgi:integrase